MSKVNKRKHVMKEMQTDDFDPPASNQLIVRILGSRGNNLHEVESAEPFATSDGVEGDSENAYRFLVSMPTKFRKNVWVKRGDFVIVEPIDEGDKVKAEIVRILTPQHIKEFTKMSIWPEKFTNKSDNDARNLDAICDDAHDDDDDDLFVNTNRQHYDVESDSESDDDSSDYDDANGSDEGLLSPPKDIASKATGTAKIDTTKQTSATKIETNATNTPRNTAIDSCVVGCFGGQDDGSGCYGPVDNDDYYYKKSDDTVAAAGSVDASSCDDNNRGDSGGCDAGGDGGGGDSGGGNCGARDSRRGD